MNKNGRKMTPGGVLAGLIGLTCALVLGAVFYGAMVYQLTGEQAQASVHVSAPSASPAPLAPGLSSAALYPGALLALSDAQLTGERAQDIACGGENCRVIERSYALPSGLKVQAVSAYPAAYLEKMALDGYAPQLITGFSLAGMDAVYALRGGEAALCAREGDYIYMLLAQADDQAMYALGVSAYLEQTGAAAAQ